jgi:hypothetical protein
LSKLSTENIPTPLGTAAQKGAFSWEEKARDVITSTAISDVAPTDSL